MPRKEKPRRIAPGIYRDGDRLVGRARVRRNGKQTEEREIFRLGTDLDEITAWIRRTEADLLDQEPATPDRGSLAAEIAAWVEALPEGEKEKQYKRDSRTIVKAWIASALATLDPQTIERRQVEAVIKTWRDKDLAASTINKRLSRLRRYYLSIDPDAPNPTDKIQYLSGPEREPRAIPAHIVKLILDSLPDRGRAGRGEKRSTVGICKLRLRVMGYSGITLASLKRVEPRHLDLSNARIYLTPRRKGRGTGPYGSWIKLLPEAVAALKDWKAADLFGKSYSSTSVAKTWRTGIRRARARAAESGDESWIEALDNLPPDCSPYDLRHSFATEIYRINGDIRAVAELLQHASLETTKRYTKAAVSEMVSKVISKAGTFYATVPTLPAPKPKRAKLRVLKNVAS